MTRSVRPSVARPLGASLCPTYLRPTSAARLTYDAAGRLVGIPGIVTSVLYDASGMPVTQSNANGTVTNRAYSPQRGFMIGIQTVMGGTTIQDFAYEPDAAGMLSTVTSPFTNETWTYAYDDLHRMTSAANQSTPAESQDFTYDVLGRITYNSKVGAYSYPTAGFGAAARSQHRRKQQLQLRRERGLLVLLSPRSPA